MVTGGNADSKPSEKKMQGEESARTIDCLRRRLLAERVASKNAKEEADNLESKLVELEKLLKEEAKSRNKAEKKLKYLMKKLESMNISDVSEHSGLVDRSDISSVSSMTSSITKEPEEKILNPQLKISTTKGSSISESEVSLPVHKDQESEIGSNDTTLLPTVPDNFPEDVAKNSSTDDEKTKTNEQSGESSNEGSHNQESDQDPENQIDDSMALVLVETPQKNEQKIDPEILDATVKEVLDALRHAKEQLQSSMERKRRVNMIRVG